MANTYSLDLESGSSQYASIADASQTGLDLDTACSFEAWINLESLPSSTNKYIILAKENTTSAGRAYELCIYNNAGTYQLLVGVGIADATNMGFRGANYTFATGTWYHVSATYLESSNTTFLYVNGVQIGTGTLDATGTLPNTNGNFTIGARCNTAQDFFDGKIEHVRVWSDVRTATEIVQYMYQEPSPSATNLVAWWKFNNDYLDETSNNNDLTASGSPVFSTDTQWTDGGVGQVGIEHCVDGDTVALWHMNGTADSADKKNDESANNLDLTENNTPTAAIGFDGTANGAYSFNGTNEYLSVADNASIDFGTADFTAECWFKTARNSAQTNSGMIAFGKIKETSTYEGYWLYMNMGATTGDRGKVAFQVRTTSGGFVGGSTTTQYNDDAWHHAVGVRTGSNIYLYIDGVLQVTTTGGNINVDNTGSLYIGTNGSSAGTNDNWDGYIDEVKLSTRAKSAEEIAKYYSGTVSAKFYPTAGDGYTYLVGLTTSWATARARTAATHVDYTGTTFDVHSGNDGNGGPYPLISRAFIPVDTSVIPDSATISLATLNTYVVSKDSNNGTDGTFTVVQTSQATTSTLVLEDFDQCGDLSSPTEGIDARIAIGSISTSAYLSWTLNTTGIGFIDKTGITKLGIREGYYDIAGNSPSTTNGHSQITITSSEGTNKPYLWVEYTSGAVDYPMTCDTVAFTLTGKNINLLRGLMMSCVTTTFALTGIDTLFKRGYGILCGIGSFILTGVGAVLRTSKWTNRTKPTTTFTDRTKPTTNWTNR